MSILLMIGYDMCDAMKTVKAHKACDGLHMHVPLASGSYIRLLQAATDAVC